MTALAHYAKDFVEKYLTMPKMYISDIVEIFIIAVIVYYIMLWFKKTRAWVIFKGLLVLTAFLVVAAIFNLSTILWIANKMLSIGILAIVIIFQPELRKALEEIGNKNIIFNVFKNSYSGEEGRFTDHALDEIVRATLELAKTKTGALIVIKNENDLGEYAKTGIQINAEISSQLLINIFEHNTPLHDGAVIIEENKIVAATCYLPLSDNLSLSKDLGTRHRAGVGVSEVTDSLVIIVSEETGSISISSGGKLIRFADSSILKKELIKAQNKMTPKEKKNKKIKNNDMKGSDPDEANDDDDSKSAD
ncbi:MAG: diadenylate cyclase CdaA [Lachnospiraceae bacterium]|nr:diadenylate cyclase CdaA [Lachnospiraceae bacterium]